MYVKDLSNVIDALFIMYYCWNRWTSDLSISKLYPGMSQIREGPQFWNLDWFHLIFLWCHIMKLKILPQLCLQITQPTSSFPCGIIKALKGQYQLIMWENFGLEENNWKETWSFFLKRNPNWATAGKKYSTLLSNMKRKRFSFFLSCFKIVLFI